MNDELQVIVQRMVEAGEPEENIKLVIENYKPTTSGGGESEPGKPLGLEEQAKNLDFISQLESQLKSSLEQRAEESVENSKDGVQYSDIPGETIDYSYSIDITETPKYKPDVLETEEEEPSFTKSFEDFISEEMTPRMPRMGEAVGGMDVEETPEQKTERAQKKPSKKEEVSSTLEEMILQEMPTGEAEEFTSDEIEKISIADKGMSTPQDEVMNYLKENEIEIPRFSSNKDIAEIYGYALAAKEKKEKEQERKNIIANEISSGIYLNEHRKDAEGYIEREEQYKSKGQKLEEKTKEKIKSILPVFADGRKTVDSVYKKLLQMPSSERERFMKGGFSDDEKTILIRSSISEDLTKNTKDLKILSERAAKEIDSNGYVSDEVLGKLISNTYKRDKDLQEYSSSLISTQDNYNRIVEDQIKLEKEVERLNNSPAQDFSRRVANSINAFVIDGVVKFAPFAAKWGTDVYLSSFGHKPNDTYSFSDSVIKWLDDSIKSRPLTVGTRGVFDESGDFDFGGAVLAAADNAGLLLGLIGGSRMVAQRTMNKLAEKGVTNPKAISSLMESEQLKFMDRAVLAGTYPDNYRAAKESGATDEEAGLLATGQSLMEVITARIMPDYKLVRPKAMKASAKELSESLAFGKDKALSNALGQFIVNVSKEEGEEIIMQAYSDFENTIRALSDPEFREKWEGVNPKDYAATAITTFLLTGTPAGVGASKTYRQYKDLVELKAAEMSDEVIPTLEQMLKMYPEKAESIQEAKRRVAEKSELRAFLPNSGEVDDETMNELIPIAQQIKDKSQQIESKEGAEKKSLKKEIDNLEETYSQIKERGRIKKQQERDAVQERETEEVPVQPEAEISEEVGEEVREQDTTEETQQEEVVPTQEQFNAALDIIEPLASQREESITVEQAEQIFEALGENASDVIDVSTLRGKSAVELYNELSEKRDESAAKQATAPTQPTTQETETVQEQPEVVEQEGETTETVDEGDRAVAEEFSKIEESDTGGFKVINDAIKDIVAEPIDKSREKVAKLKAMMQERVDRAKADKDAKDFISRAIKDMIRQSGLTNVSRSTLNKLLAKVPKANRKNLRNIIEEAVDVIQNQVERKEASIRRSNRKKAINKVKSIGVLKELQEPLKNMLSINPDTLPKSARDAYDKVVRDLSMANRKYDRASREELLNLIQNVNTKYMKDLSRLDAVLNRLGDGWSADKTFKENMESVKDDLNESETEILNRYKSELDVKDSDSEVNTKKIKEQFEEAKSQIPKEMSGLTTEERAAHEKAKNIKTEEFDELSPQEQRKLVRGLEMLNDGFVGSNLLQGLSRVEAIRRANSIPKNLRQSGLLRKIYPNIRGAVKNFFKQDKESILKETIRSTPLKNLEQIFRTASKEFQKTNLYEALFRPTSVAFSKTESDMKEVNKVLSAAQDLLSTNPNERFKQKAKIMMYQLQKEFDSNPNNPEVNSAKEWVKATLEDPNSIYNDKEKAIIKEMMDGFIKDGEVDSKLIEESFTEKEKRAESLIRRAYDSLTDKAEADAAYRGIPFRTRKDYVHLPKTQKNSDQNIKDLDELREQFLQPSLKSKAAIERTGKTHAISLDPIANANASARKTITSYHMYPAVREAKMTFGYLIKNTEGKENKEIAEVLEEVYGEIVDSQYKASLASRSYTDRMLDKGMREIARLGYSAQLAGVVRAGWEFISNATHAVLVNPVEFVAGMDFLATHFKDGDMSTINEAIKNVGSTQSTRLAGEETLSSKDIETRLLDKKEFFNPERSGSEFKGKAKAAGSILGKFPRGVRAFNEFLMSQPDTSISKAIFIGNFNKTFKEKTGQSPNWNKLATDQAYREKYAEAIEEATSVADSAVIDSVASTNPFDGIPKNITDRQAGTIYRAYQMFDRYMTKFRTFEYYSTIKAIDSLMGRGELNERDAAFLLAGTLLRMSMYKMGIDVTFGILFQALGIEDEEDDLEFKDEAIKSSIGAVITLAMGRNLGNVANLGINYGVEQINKELGEGITRNEEEYNRYKDSVVFNKIPMEDEFTETFMLDILTDMSGAYAPLLKTMKRAGVDIARLKKAKTEKTKNKYETELYQRIPFEILGNLGLIPAYKDLRKMMIQYNFQKSKEKNISDKDIINVFTKGMSSQEKKMFIEQLRYEDKRRAKDMKDRFKIK